MSSDSPGATSAGRLYTLGYSTTPVFTLVQLMSHTSDSVCVPQLLAWACSTTSQRLKVETSPVTMLICGTWVVVALVIVAHSAGAAEGLLLLLFLPLPLAPPEAKA